MENLEKLRNIGISAHIDSGKTTLTERILFYAGKIHKIEEIRGGGDGATMDWMEQEKERGITITSAATTVSWNGNPINIIDTPGHVDFTVLVERSLRVLDSAVLVVTAVEGVQSQTLTVDRQMKRYKIPRIVFVNKMDRTGANPPKVITSLEEKLGLTIVPMQIPIGLEMDFVGIVDLLTMEAAYFDGEDGEVVRREEIPDNLKDKATKARQGMLEAVSLYSDELMTILLEEEEPPMDLVIKTIREATISLQMVPLVFGSAYKNKGVQPLLDCIINFMPSPLEQRQIAYDNDNEQATVEVEPDDDKPLIAMAFKLVEEQFGQVTYMRVYQGTLKKGENYVNTRSKKKTRISRILRVHSDEREDISEAGAGDIVAVMGLDCATGDTFCGGGLNYSLESIFAPEPVISLSINPSKRADSDKLSKALNRFMREDPTFRVRFDQETQETIISGMGELHLEIYVDRIKREYGVECSVGQPKVSYRETCTKAQPYDHTRKKQTGGSGQFGKIVGEMQPLPEDSEEHFVFEENIVQGRIPSEYIPSVEKGFKRAMEKGPLAGFEVIGVKMILNDGAYHDVDSSTMAFELTAFECFRETFRKAGPVLLEPIMKVEVECPGEFLGPVTGQISSRRGIIVGTESNEGFGTLRSEVPLSEMFGYSNDLRSMTQGKGTFTMEFYKYRRLPSNLQDEVIKKVQEEEAAKKKK